MLITYEISISYDQNLILSRGTLKASEKPSIGTLGADNNILNIKSATSVTQTNINMEREIRISNCNHVDGAAHVAQYIVNEIQRNVNSSIADQIRYHLTGEISNNLQKKFEDIEAKIKKASKETGYPIYGSTHRHRSKVRARELWFNQVNTDKPWDHKNKIREKFKHVAVHRPLPLPSIRWSETYFHKHLNYDYYLDIWSNIHYGYVGRSVGFSAYELLKGSNIAQFVSNARKNKIAGDSIDDHTSMKIGIDLFEQYSHSRNISANIILNKITSKPDSSFPVSRIKHYCFR